ncbi:DUF2132 domain-containing protein [Chromobacterium phragmitis]|uniref:DUF2132 domain-containing protein n=1 Tax=Chromobacterium phragmitis TaxID=2202141 RepID=A0A344UIW3_9NEIS|nr:VF530 family protein [Chromobacterium phragmitis]AXE29818.1 DUF2132 domain-containing protein [Chromobacterium phragmitis]AXE35211.1 DUF2132 domain-containing protein [Chromobacterium phragmitis]
MSGQANNPTHGVTLEMMLEQLQAHYGWDGLAARVDIRCFRNDPSVKSSLAFLRRTPWARAKVEALYVEMKSRPADNRPRLFGKKSS